MQIRGPAVFALVVALSAFASRTEAATWDVGRDAGDCPDGCDFHDGTVGAGVGGGLKAAMVSLSVFPGDTILVYPRLGALPEDSCLESNAYLINFEMKVGVTVAAGLGPGTVCINAATGLEPAIFFINANEATVVDGLRITWDSSENGLGGGVACYTSSGVVKNCIFQNCLAGTGAGIYQFLSDVRVENNLFVSNRCEAGAGVLALSTSNPVIVGNTFFGSIAPFGLPGSAIYTTDSNFTLDRNIFSDSQGASAIYCSGPSPSSITCNVFWNNALGPFGGGCADTTGASGNTHADPGFCNPDGFDFSMCVSSPALTGPCGPIGYTPPTGAEGCPTCPSLVSIETASWGKIKSLYR